VKCQGYQTVVSGVKNPEHFTNLERLAHFDGMLKEAIGRPRGGSVHFD
jgi:hypothetical protein